MLKKYSHVIILGVLSLVTVLALFRLGDIDLSAATLSQVHWGWFAAAVLAYYSGVVVRGWRWRRILGIIGYPIGIIYAQALLIAGMFVSAVVPARAGDVGRVAMLKRDYDIPVSQGVASLAAERALDVFAILILTALGVIWAVQGRVPPEVSTLILISTGLFGVGLVGLVAVPSFEPLLRRLGSWLPERLHSFYEKVLDFGFSLINGVRALASRPMVLSLAIVESLYIWLCDALVIYFALFSVAEFLPLSASLFTGMVSALVAAVPLTPGALGQYDSVVIGLLALFGVGIQSSTMVILITRLINLWTFIPISGVLTYAFGFARLLEVKPSETREPAYET